MTLDDVIKADGEAKFAPALTATGKKFDWKAIVDHADDIIKLEGKDKYHQILGFLHTYNQYESGVRGNLEQIKYKEIDKGLKGKMKVIDGIHGDVEKAIGDHGELKGFSAEEAVGLIFGTLFEGKNWYKDARKKLNDGIKEDVDIALNTFKNHYLSAAYGDKADEVFKEIVGKVKEGNISGKTTDETGTAFERIYRIMAKGYAANELKSLKQKVIPSDPEEHRAMLDYLIEDEGMKTELDKKLKANTPFYRKLKPKWKKKEMYQNSLGSALLLLSGQDQYAEAFAKKTDTKVAKYK